MGFQKYALGVACRYTFSGSERQGSPSTFFLCCRARGRALHHAGRSLQRAGRSLQGARAGFAERGAEVGKQDLVRNEREAVGKQDLVWNERRRRWECRKLCRTTNDFSSLFNIDAQSSFEIGKWSLLRHLENMEIASRSSRTLYLFHSNGFLL